MMTNRPELLVREYFLVGNAKSLDSSPLFFGSTNLKVASNQPPAAKVQQFYVWRS